MGGLEFYDEDLVSFSFPLVLSPWIIFIFYRIKRSLSPKSGEDAALDWPTCHPYQGLQYEIVTPSRGCHHLDIAACSLCQWELSCFAPRGFLRPHRSHFCGPPRITRVAGFLAAGHCQIARVPSLPCPTPSGVEACVGKTFIRGFSLGEPSDKEAVCVSSSVLTRRLGPASPYSCLPLELVTPLPSLRRASLQPPELQGCPPIVNTIPLGFADE